MQKTELQKQAHVLIGQLSIEKLKEAVDYLVELQDKDADNILPTPHAQFISGPS